MVHLPAHRRRAGSLRLRHPRSGASATAPWLTVRRRPAHGVPPPLPRVRHPGHRSAHRQGPARVPRHAHGGTLLRGAAGPLRARAGRRGGDHHRLRPRIRVRGPQRGSRGGASLAALPAGRPRRARQPVPVPGRLEQGRRAGLPDPHAGPARHRPVLPDRPQHPAAARAATRTRPATCRTSAPTPSSPTPKPSGGPGLRALDHLRPELWRLLRTELPLLRPRGASRGARHRRPGPAVGPRGPGIPGHLPARRGPQRRILRLVPGGPGRGQPDRPASAGHRGVPARRRPPHRGAVPDGGLVPGRQHPGGRACTTCWRTPSSARPTATGSRTPSWSRSAASFPGPPTPCTP